MTTTSPTGLRPAQRPPHRPQHRVLTLLIVVLLIAIPGGYLVRSAFQSRDSGKDKERRAAATNLSYSYASRVQRNIYEVPLPSHSSHYAYYESNSWKTSSLYVQFRVPEKQLADFLDDAGTKRSALRDGDVTITDKHAENVGWNLKQEGHDYAGTTVDRAKGRPDVAITVDRTYKSRPRVYVVSTVKF